MLTLYKRPDHPLAKESFIVKWSGYPIGVIYHNDCLPLPLEYTWSKNSEFGPCTSGNAASLEEAKADFQKHWLNCLQSLGLRAIERRPS